MKSLAKPEVSLFAARCSEKTTSFASSSPYSPWHWTPCRSVKTHSSPSSEDVQLSARSASMKAGLACPGWIRTSPLNIQCSSPLSGVVVATCGSSLPASADAIPMFKVVPAAWAYDDINTQPSVTVVSVDFLILPSQSLSSCLRKLWHPPVLLSTG